MTLRGSLIGWRSHVLLGLGLVVDGGLKIDTDRLIKLQWDKVQNNSPSLQWIVHCLKRVHD